MPRTYAPRLPITACPHTDRKHQAFGMCNECYQVSRRPESTRRKDMNKSMQPGYFRNRHLIRTYGITKDQQDAMFVAQSGKCAICAIQMTHTKPHTGTSLAVDHDHITKVVRGLLCHFCNIGIGAFKDNQDSLLAAVKYLKDKSCL